MPCPVHVAAVDTLAPSHLPAEQVGAPLYPPSEWFARPASLEPGDKITVVTDGPEQGRVYGYVAPWGQCLLDGTPDCWTAPQSPTGYGAALQGDTVCADGSVVRTANIGGGVNHASGGRSFNAVVDHYANTAALLMRVVYGEDAYGIWAAGCLWPEATWADVALIRQSALSGDWRWRPQLGAYDMAGSQLVLVPGFPLTRPHPAYHALGSAGGPALRVVGGFGGAYAPVDDEEGDGMPGQSPVTVIVQGSDTTPGAGQTSLGTAPAMAAHPAGCTCGTHVAAQPAAPMPPGAPPAAGPPAGDEALAARVDALDERLGRIEAMLGEQAEARFQAELAALDAPVPLPA